MRARIRKGSRLDYRDEDLGDGFYISRERHGSCVWFYAMQLDAPGGYVVRGHSAKFSYRRDALAQIEAWRASEAKLYAAINALSDKPSWEKDQ